MANLTIEHNGKADLVGCEGTPCGEICEKQGAGRISCPIQKAIEKLKYYEELDGKGLIPKCIVGDTAYFVKQFRGTYYVKAGDISELYYNCEMKLCATVKGQGRGILGVKVFVDFEEATNKCNELNC